MASGSSSYASQPQPLAGLQSTRQCKSLFRYPLESEAAFIELKDDTLSGDELFQVLEGVPGVEGVTRKGTQASGHLERLTLE